MLEQLSLFETPQAARNRYRLFLAIFPDAEAVQSIRGYQISFREEFGLRGKPRPSDNLHVTLHHIEDYPEIPERVVASTIEACTKVLAGRSSFDVTFDHAMSFSGSQAFVLANPNGNVALMDLHRLLITELIMRRLATVGDFKFLPHVTMLYDKRIVPKAEVDSVRWKVKEVVLVLSHLGATKYERLGSWNLND